jgi:hypothetical protein
MKKVNISVFREFFQRLLITIDTFRPKKVKGETFLTRKPRILRTIAPSDYQPFDESKFNDWATKMGVYNCDNTVLRNS